MLNREVGPIDRKSKKKKPTKKSQTRGAPPQVSFELVKAHQDRAKANRALDNIDEKWNKKLNKIAEEAQKLVSPSDIEAEQRDEIARLLDEINASQERQLNLNAKLDGLRGQIYQEETLNLTRLTEQALDREEERARAFHENEEEIEKELEAANHALDQKQRAIRREEESIKDLHA